jgi:CheY-like chemotaxis protein/HPt (histidine-containing phosphotransfer) domain-containing protein
VILVVEDTPVNQAVAVHMLERCGYRADVAENGREALSVLARRPYAAVLMDCQMPELDGYATTREIRRGEPAGRRLPIIAMTANSMHGERERCLVAGMDDYLCKPLRTRDLKDALARLVLEPPAGPQGTGAATSATGAVAGSGAAGGRGAVDGNGAVDGSGVERFLDEAVIGEIENVDGDLLTQLVSLYFEQTAGILAELADSIRRGETLAAAEAAHKLKGGSLTLGAEYVSRLALELEASARAGDLPAARDLLDRLGPGLEQTFTAFHARSGRTGRPEALCRTE